jgi:hypothetical protein
VCLLIPWKEFDLYVVVTTIAMLALVYALADWARKQGQGLEPGLYKEIGGKPSVKMMYRADDSLDQASKDRYRSLLSAKINEAEPTAACEEKTPAQADAFYELASTWLREHTRDAKTFSILSNENCSYGFRRNLLGIKWPALALNFVVVAICAAVLWYNWPMSMSDDMAKRMLVVLIVAGAHAVYFLMAVRRQNVITASRTYARQLILSCETLLTPQRSAASAKTKRKAVS